MDKRTKNLSSILLPFDFVPQPSLVLAAGGLVELLRDIAAFFPSHWCMLSFMQVNIVIYSHLDIIVQIQVRVFRTCS